MQRNRGNNSMGKARDLLKKIRDTMGKFHAKTDTIKDEMVWALEKKKILR